MRLHRLDCAKLVLLLSVAVLGCPQGTPPPYGPSSLVFVEVTPPAATIAKGTSQQFTATAAYSDGATKDVTTQGTWTSSAASVATVGAMTGKAMGAGPGLATISVAFQGKTGTAGLTVTAATVSSLSVTPTTAMVGLGTTTQLTAMAKFGDGSMQDVTQQASWSSDTQSVATVSSVGLVTGVAAGMANVTASLGGKMASAVVTVPEATLTAISVAPALATIAKGTAQAFQATGTFSDGHGQDLTNQVTWSASPTSTATVAANGVATGVAGGQATISAAFQGKTGTATLTVTEAVLVTLAITPDNGSAVKGATRQFMATGTFSEGAPQDLTSQVTWASDPASVATVSNAAGTRGLVTAVDVGKASIGAAFHGVTASTALTVVAQAPSLTSLSPTSGGQDGGTTVSLTGTNLTGATAVKFGTTMARSFSVVSSTQITAITPPGRGMSSVMVTTPTGSSNALYFTYAPPPSLATVSPSSGPQSGGSVVTLTGTGFTGATDVSFGTTPAMSFMVVSDTTITAVAPAGTGGVNVTVVGPYGRSGRVPYAYGLAPSVTGLNPTSGAEGGGTAVTITGTGLTDVAAVRFGPTPAVSFTVVSTTQITAVAPAGVGSVNVSVTTGNGNSNGLVFTYRSAPTTSDVSPNAGPLEGGNTVLISGAGLTGATAVSFGGTPALYFGVVSDGQITAVAPPGTGVAAITVTTQLGTSAGLTYSYGPRPTIASLTPSSGPLTGGITINLAGTALAQTDSVWFDDQSLPFTILSDSALTLVLPPGTGSVNVRVANVFGISDPATFSYGPSPAITSLSPSSGPEPAGTSVVIHGTSFTGATAVTFDGFRSVSYTVDSDTQITAVVPAGIAVVQVRVTTPFATSNAAPYTHLAPPAITSFTPTSGPNLGGTTVSITGTGFTGATSLTFGATPATSYTVVSDTQILATSPAGTGTTTITVVTPNGMNTSSSSFTYIPPSVITSLAPTTGPEAGATTVTLTGTNFTGATAVAFGATPATSFTVNSNTQIVATLPAGTGTVTVVVTTPSGAGTGASFTYVPAPSITSISPTFGPEPGSTVVTITGAALTGATSVNFGATPATSFTVNSATQIVATAPAGTGVVAVTVTNTYGTSNSQPFTYGPVPALTMLSRTQGSTLGGQTVILTGTSLTGATAVTFGATPATSFTVDSDTQITAVSPAGAGIQNVTATTAFGTTNGLMFTYGLVPSIGLLAPSTGTDTGGTTVNVTGTHFTGTTAVTFGATPAASFTVVSDLSVTAVSPAGSGSVSFTMTNAFGTSDPTTFTFGPTAVIGALSPTQGTTAGGTTVTITGTSFTGATAVTFGATPASSFTVVSPTQITAVSPAGGAGSASVAVTTPFGTSAGSTFTYGAPPTVTSATASTGPQVGGNSVVIAGTGLSLATAVSFGATPATSFTVDSATQITATAPAGTGAVLVSVTTPYGSASTGYGYVAPPTVSMLSVTTGPEVGGTTVTITGTDLSTTTGVTFGAPSATGLTINSNTSITVIAPAGTGAVSVVVTTAYGTNSSPPSFTYVPPPTITSLSLTGGGTAGGNTLTITGTSLTGITSVSFGAVLGTVGANTATSVSVTSPAALAGAVTVRVTNPYGTSNGLGFTYFDAPSITTISPSAGPKAGGNMVTITGSAFTGATQVTFDGVDAAAFMVMSGTTIVATPAAEAFPNTVDVVVTNPGGSATAVSGYTFVAAPGVGPVSPNAGSIAGGTTVVITGTNLAGATDVTFGGTSVSMILSNTPTAIFVVTAAHAAGTVDVVVTTTGGSDAHVNGFTFVDTPTISAITPNQGPTAGGQSVVITGTDFNTASSVKFDGVDATIFTVDSDTQITATTPGGFGAVDVVVAAAGGTATAAGGFTYVFAPGIAGPSPNAGSLAGGETITITGANLNFVNLVTIDGVDVGTITHVAPTLIRVVAPAHATAATVLLVVSSPGGTDMKNYRYMDPPTITMILPSSGATAGGDTVVITGTNFQGGSVSIDGVTVNSYSVDSDTQITFTTDAHPSATVDVTVDAPGGSATVVGGFDYL